MNFSEYLEEKEGDPIKTNISKGIKPKADVEEEDEVEEESERKKASKKPVKDSPTK